MYDLALLHEEVAPEAALRLLAIWQASHKQERSERPAMAQPQVREVEPVRHTTLVGRPKIQWDDHAKARQADSA